MLHSRCAFCAHHNPAGSKFCNECGSPLHLKPCGQCDAVNDYEAAACYRCGAAFAQTTPDQQREDVVVENVARTSLPEAFAESLTAATARAEAPAPDVARNAVEDVPASPVPASLAPPDLRNAADIGSPPLANEVVSAPASDVASVPSLVVPPDEERLNAARDVAVARRRRRTRIAIAALLVIAAAGAVYYEYPAADPFGNWLRATRTSLLEALSSRAQRSPSAVDDAARASEPASAQPTTKADDAAATPPPVAAPPTENAASPAPPESATTEPPAATPKEPQAAAPPAPSAVAPDATERPKPKRSAPDRKRRTTRGSPAALASPMQVAREWAREPTPRDA